MSALFLALGSPSRAWGPVGHKAIAMLAQSRLSPQALKAIKTILGPGVPLEKVATCADDLAFTVNPALSCAGFAVSLQVDPAKVDWSLPDDALTAQAAALAGSLGGGPDAAASTTGDLAVAAALESPRHRPDRHLSRL